MTFFVFLNVAKEQQLASFDSSSFLVISRAYFMVILDESTVITIKFLVLIFVWYCRETHVPKLSDKIL